MKPIPFPSKGQICDRCGKNIFAFTTPNGADWTTCPICGYNCLCCHGSYHISNESNESNERDEFNKLDLEYHYCFECNILYTEGRIHAENGCTDSIYWGKLIESYTYKDITYEGMPQFESISECAKLLSQMQLNWQCTGFGDCSNAYYKQ